MTTEKTPRPRLDVRTIPPHERHPLIFATFGMLDAGEALELVNDHDPWPLRGQFDARHPGQFDWSYLEQGPTWRVEIRRLQAPTGNCCGACGGA